jgi:hypothetical protein
MLVRSALAVIADFLLQVVQKIRHKKTAGEAGGSGNSVRCLSACVQNPLTPSALENQK